MAELDLKRIVLRHSNGLYQILGTTPEQPAALLKCAGADIDGKTIPIHLIAAKPRYYLFTVGRAPEQPEPPYVS